MTEIEMRVMKNSEHGSMCLGALSSDPGSDDLAA